MRLISMRAWGLVLLSALLQILIFPMAGPLPVWRASLAWVALVPFLLALLLPNRAGNALTLRQAAALGYLCGVTWYVGNCYWIYQTMYLYGGLPKPVALGILLLFALYLGLYHVVFACLLIVVKRLKWGTSGALALAPFLWVAVELTRARITGFPWDLLGNSQIDNVFVTRLAPVAGVMGISFVVMVFNAVFADALMGIGKIRRAVGGASLVVALVLSMVGVKATGSLEAVRAITSPYAVMVQENLAVGATGRDSVPLSPGEELTLFSVLSLAPKQETMPEKGRLPAPQIILWPEAPSHFQSNDIAFRQSIAELAQRAGSPVVVGSLGVDLASQTPRGYRLYDSATLFDAAGSYQGRYDKIHLVPWGEYIPFKRFFAFAQKLTEGVGDMDAGNVRTVFHTGGHTYGVFICYESIFGDEVREFVNNGAEVLVNISDDGWYGDTGAPWQHLNMARMRAIENHRWVLRCTNTGITTSIDPLGRADMSAPRHIRASFAFPFEFETGTTFYTRHGDWFAYLCGLIAAMAASLGMVRPHRLN